MSQKQIRELQQNPHNVSNLHAFST